MAAFPAAAPMRLAMPSRPQENGAQGRDRTTDTAIFSRMLYQLSYLGMAGEWTCRPRRDALTRKRLGIKSA